MTLAIFIRDRIDPFQRDAFEAGAQRWLEIIPACGGDPVGDRLPHAATDTIADSGRRACMCHGPRERSCRRPTLMPLWRLRLA